MREPVDIQGNGEIRMIGDRKSGKTTFMAALAYWPNGNPENSPIQSVEPFDTNTAKLIEMAQDILENGQQLPPTPPNQQPLYSLIIQLKPNFLRNPIAAVTLRNIRLQISCREYAGELLEQLSNNNPDLKNYLDDCASASGLLVLIDGTSTSVEKDKKYDKALNNLRNELELRFKKQSNRNKNQYRIAFVFSKAETSEVWIYRNNIKQFIGLKFPKTQITLKKWLEDWKCQVAYFSCSAFGTMGKNKPNYRDIHSDGKGTIAVIARSEFWEPFGLVEPIYWLHTGKRDIRLRQI